MTEVEFFDQLEALLEPLGSTSEDGELFSDPPLDVLRYERRSVQLSWVPILGHATSVVATVCQPTDLSGALDSHQFLLDRVIRAVHGRFPPWPKNAGLAVGLTLIVLTAEPIQHADEDRLAQLLKSRMRRRVVPLALIRINLVQEAMAAALGIRPDDLFREPSILIDGFGSRLGRFVPPLEL